MDLKPFHLPNQLLLGAGPCNCSPRVLSALAMQGLTPVDKDTLHLLDEVREMLKQLFFTKNRLTLAQQTSGSGGLETVLANLVEPGEKIIVAIGGVWGERTAQMAETFNIEVVRMNLKPGEVYTMEELEKAIIKHNPKLLFITHGESSTGVKQPLEGLGDICHRYNCLLAVDAIITIGSDPLFVDDWKLDAVVGATQKGIGAPPGFALLTFSPLAEKIAMNRKSPVPFYFNLKGLAYYWSCFGEKPGYYYTYSSNMLAALREALAEKLEEKMENVWKRHKEVSEYFWKRVEAIGLKMFVQKRENRLNSVHTVILPDDINLSIFLEYLYDKHGISVGFGIGPTANQNVIRLGLMAINARMNMVDHVEKVLVESLEVCRSRGIDGCKREGDGIFRGK